jgi:hypothetical protein
MIPFLRRNLVVLAANAAWGLAASAWLRATGR